MASITGFGDNYELHLSKAKALKILDGLHLPKIGYETTIECILDDNYPEFKHYLMLGNYSGDYMLTCCTVSRDKWVDVFNCPLYRG